MQWPNPARRLAANPVSGRGVRLCGIALVAALAGTAMLDVHATAADPAVASGTATAGAVPAPPDGVYAADFCSGSAAPKPAPTALQCSAARMELAAGRARVLLHDFVYRMRFDSTELTLTLTQGLTQIDDFSAPYAWQGSVLGFADIEKGVRYEVRLGRRLAPR